MCSGPVHSKNATNYKLLVNQNKVVLLEKQFSLHIAVLQTLEIHTGITDVYIIAKHYTVVLSSA